MRKQSGFTLIELMVVMLIIAILVGISVPVYSLARNIAWKNSCKANLRIIDGAILIYKAQNGDLPYASKPSWNSESGFEGTLVDPDYDTEDLVPYYIKSLCSAPKAGHTPITGMTIFPRDLHTVHFPTTTKPRVREPGLQEPKPTVDRTSLLLLIL